MSVFEPPAEAEVVRETRPSDRRPPRVLSLRSERTKERTNGGSSSSSSEQVPRWRPLVPLHRNQHRSLDGPQIHAAPTLCGRATPEPKETLAGGDQTVGENAFVGRSTAAAAAAGPLLLVIERILLRTRDRRPLCRYFAPRFQSPPDHLASSDLNATYLSVHSPAA
uniref:Uncharacterized protein n=1 Tax=Plectus sambesii TaxID=2011161 RepID=A0A914VU50_9BILA